jgi:CRP-like cAMP-binding protein
MVAMLGSTEVRREGPNRPSRYPGRPEVIAPRDVRLGRWGRLALFPAAIGHYGHLAEVSAMRHVAESVSRGSPAAATALDRLSPRSRRLVESLGRTERFATGATILREDSDTPFLGFVTLGRVALRLRVPERGQRITMVTVEAGEILGWSALVAPYRATADAFATTTTDVHAVDAVVVRELLLNDCQLAAELLPIVLEAVSRRLSATWSQLADLALDGTPEPW